MSDDGEDERYDLGVLFVHGIGQQAPGQTLTAWADLVIRWLQVWLRQEPEPGAVEVGAAELGPVPEDPAAPAQVELRVVAAGRADGQPATPQLAAGPGDNDGGPGRGCAGTRRVGVGFERSSLEQLSSPPGGPR